MASPLSGSDNSADVGLANDIYNNYQQNFDVVHTQLVASYSDLLAKVNQQNELIDNELSKTTQARSTDFRKSDYENIDTHKMMGVYTYIFWIYYIIVIAFSIYILFISMYGRVIKGAIIVFFVLFPWLLQYTEFFVYHLFMWLYSIATSTIYSNAYMNKY